MEKKEEKPEEIQEKLRRLKEKAPSIMEGIVNFLKPLMDDDEKGNEDDE